LSQMHLAWVRRTVRVRSYLDSRFLSFVGSIL
jgi:hypothetical protein